MHPYTLPPGYAYELLTMPNPRLAIVDRGGEPLVSAPVDWANYFDVIAYLWRAVDENPFLAGIHIAAFMTWRLDRSPLDQLVDWEIGP